MAARIFLASEIPAAVPMILTSSRKRSKRAGGFPSNFGVFWIPRRGICGSGLAISQTGAAGGCWLGGRENGGAVSGGGTEESPELGVATGGAGACVREWSCKCGVGWSVEAERSRRKESDGGVDSEDKEDDDVDDGGLGVRGESGEENWEVGFNIPLRCRGVEWIYAPGMKSLRFPSSGKFS